MKTRLTACALLAALVGLIAGQSSAQPPVGTPPGLLDFVFVRTVVVGPVGDGSDTAANGAALLAALDSITDNSAVNPYLLRAEPGIYDLGAAFLNMKAFVVVEGSGVMITLFRGQGGSVA